MAKRSGDKRPYVRPVTRIELSEKNIKLRWILIAVLLSIAVVSIGIGISEIVNVQPGWNEVQVSSKSPNYSSEFRFMYDFSDTGGNAAAVNKELIGIYSDAMEDSYRLFSKDADEQEVHNLYYLNRHVNEPVEVPQALYDAFALLESYGSRCLYLAPVYVEYNRVFSSESDVEAAQYDPTRNPEAESQLQELMGFLTDEQSVRLELLGNNQVCLRVSEEYLAYAEENGIVEFLDFGWMRNAFVADYVAQTLLDQGYTQGYLASFDGFNRTLGEMKQPLEFNIYDRQGMDIYVPGVMQYQGPMSIVFLRDYPLTDADRWNYRVYGDGHITCAMVDPAEARSRSAVENLVSYSGEYGCARVLLEMLPCIWTDSFREDQVMELTGKGIYSIWCRENVLVYNQPGLMLTADENQDGVVYQVEYKEK